MEGRYLLEENYLHIIRNQSHPHPPSPLLPPPKKKFPCDSILIIRKPLCPKERFLTK